MNRERGFTLTELMVAVLVGAIVISTLVTITRSMSQEATNQQMNVEASQRARTGLHMLKADFVRTGSAPRIAAARPPSAWSASSGANAAINSAYTYIPRRGPISLNPAFR